MTNPPTDRRPDVLAHARFVKDRLLIAHAKGRLPHRVKRPFHPSQTGVGVGVDHRHPRSLLATRAGTTGCPQFVGRRSPPTSVGFPAGFGLASSGHFGRVLDAPAALNVTPFVLARFVITPVLDQPTEVGAARWLDPDGYIGMPLCLPRRIVDNDARGAALPKPLPSARTPRLRKGNRSAVSPSPGLTSHTPPLHRFNRLGCSGSPRLRNRNRRGGSTGTAAGKPLASVGTGREKSPSHFPSSGTGAV
jgi:hypothetical protein